MLFYTLFRHDNLSFLNETTQDFSSVPLFCSFLQSCEDLQASKTNCLKERSLVTTKAWCDLRLSHFSNKSKMDYTQGGGDIFLPGKLVSSCLLRFLNLLSGNTEKQDI